MRSRRQFLQISLVALAASAARAVLLRDQPTAAPQAPAPPSAPAPLAVAPAQAAPLRAAPQIWAPMVNMGAPAPTAPLPSAPPPTALQARQDVWLRLAQASPPARGALIVAPPSGTAAQALAWLLPRASGYSAGEVTAIVSRYQFLGDATGLDWFLALAQLAHETGSLTSWWSQPPRRNPAGIGVNGSTRAGLADGTPGPAPGPDWAWNEGISRWCAGVSFLTWDNDAIPAHLGRLLAYALRDDQVSPLQQELIEHGLGYRSFDPLYRGSAPSIVDLNGVWAVPGTDYGQRIMALAQRMRGEA